jgi:hypothetical protein
VDNGIEDEPKALIRREDMSLAEYADWPDPEAGSAKLHLIPSGDNSIEELSLDSSHKGRRVRETIVRRRIIRRRGARRARASRRTGSNIRAAASLSRCA